MEENHGRAASWGVYFWNAYIRGVGASFATLRRRAGFNGRKGRAARARLHVKAAWFPKDHPMRRYIEGRYITEEDVKNALANWPRRTIANVGAPWP